MKNPVRRHAVNPFLLALLSCCSFAALPGDVLARDSADSFAAGSFEGWAQEQGTEESHAQAQERRERAQLRTPAPRSAPENPAPESGAVPEPAADGGVSVPVPDAGTSLPDAASGLPAPDGSLPADFAPDVSAPDVSAPEAPAAVVDAAPPAPVTADIVSLPVAEAPAPAVKPAVPVAAPSSAVPSPAALSAAGEVPADGRFIDQIRMMLPNMDKALAPLSLDLGGEGRQAPPAPEADFEGWRRMAEVQGFQGHIRDAVRTHPSIEASLLAWQQAEQAVREARAGWLPQLSASIDSQAALKRRDDSSYPTGASVDGVLSVDQLLFDGGGTSARIDEARSNSRGEEARSETVTQQFTVRAIVAYYDVIRYSVQLALAQDNLQRHGLIMEQVRWRTEGGIGQRGDFLRAQGRHAEAQSRLALIQGQLDRALADYHEVFRAEPAHGLLPPSPPQAFGGAAQQALIARALESNPRLREAKSRYQAAGYAADAENATLWPRLSLALDGREIDLGGEDRDNEVLARVVTSYPLYTGGRQAAQRRRAELRARQAEQEAQNVRLDVERQIRFALADMQTQKARLDSLAFAVRTDNQTFSDYLELFAVGRYGLNELLDAQRDLFNNAIAMTDNRVLFDISYYILLSLTGELLQSLSIESRAPQQ